MTRRLITAFTATALAIAAAGCGEEEVIVPTAEELVQRTVTAADLGDPWRSIPEAEPQVITDETRGDLATLDVCADASEDDRRRATELPWQVIGAAGYVTDPPPTFTPTLTASLLADDPASIRDTFEMLQTAMTACLPTSTVLTDAGEFEVTELDTSSVGEDRFGVRYRQTDQPEGNDRWDVRHVILREGPILMWLSVIEITASAETVVDDAEFDAAIVVATSRLADETPPETTAQIANPASVYCEEQGGTVEIVDETDGQVGYCVLPDGTRIEEWEFFRSSTSTTAP